MNIQSAIQGVIAALKNQAASIALANNVYTPADWGNDPETHAKAEHDGLLLWADSLQAVANRITQLEAENAALRTDAECFRFWVREAAQSPCDMAKLIMRCVTEQDYRDAITPIALASCDAIQKASEKSKGGMA